jgi:hypothetical protein
MNNRILELAKQAGLIQYESDGKWEEVQKFAELIVRECLKQADIIRDVCEADGKDEQALGADWVGLAIDRHFGVES